MDNTLFLKYSTTGNKGESIDNLTKDYSNYYKNSEYYKNWGLNVLPVEPTKYRSGFTNALRNVGRWFIDGAGNVPRLWYSYKSSGQLDKIKDYVGSIKNPRLRRYLENSTSQQLANIRGDYDAPSNQQERQYFLNMMAKRWNTTPDDPLVQDALARAYIKRYTGTDDFNKLIDRHKGMHNADMIDAGVGTVLDAATAVGLVGSAIASGGTATPAAAAAGAAAKAGAKYALRKWLLKPTWKLSKGGTKLITGAIYPQAMGPAIGKGIGSTARSVMRYGPWVTAKNTTKNIAKNTFSRQGVKNIAGKSLIYGPGAYWTASPSGFDIFSDKGFANQDVYLKLLRQKLFGIPFVGPREFDEALNNY